MLEQHRELVAAESGQRVASPELAAEHARELAEQGVARDVAAGIVHGLEAVQIQVAEPVGRARFAGACDHAAQAALELEPVDQPGERVVGRLVRQLAGQLALWRRVPEDHDDPGEPARVIVQRCRGLVDGELDPVAAHEHEMAGESHRSILVETALGRGLDRLPGRFVEHGKHAGERFSPRFGEAPSGEVLRDRIEVLDHSPPVSRDHRIGDGGKRDQGALPLAEQRGLGLFPLRHVGLHADHPERVPLAVALHHPAPVVDPPPLASSRAEPVFCFVPWRAA